MMAAALLLVGTAAPVPQVLRAIGLNVPPYRIRMSLQELHEAPRGDVVYAAITRLSDFLCSNGSPIEYQRRRDLDYGNLLSDDAWAEICCETGHGQTRMRRQAVAARAYLFERLSALAIDDRRAPLRIDQVRSNVEAIRAFPFWLSTSLAERLEREACAFLTEQGIREPVSWCPPLGIVNDLDLPGIDLESVDASALRRAGLRPSATVSRLAAQFDISSFAVRHLLAMHPIDLVSVRNANFPVSSRWADTPAAAVS